MKLKERVYNDNIRYILYSDIEEVFGPDLFAEFEKWYMGQTGLLLENGQMGVYPCDVANFIHKMKTGKELFFD